jgi:hypothetical protein
MACQSLSVSNQPLDSDAKKSEVFMITPKDEKLMIEIQQDKEAYEKLKAKARWEQMPLYAVLKDYGDPREW